MFDCLKLLLLVTCVTCGCARVIISKNSSTVQSSNLQGAGRRLLARDSTTDTERIRPSAGGSSSGGGRGKGPFLLIKQAPEPEYLVGLHESVILECEAVGSLAPSIHWLKDNVRITQDVVSSETVPEEMEALVSTRGSLSSTKSRLYLDCTGPRDEGIYTCVAETPFQRVSASTTLLSSGAVLPLLNPSCTAPKKSYIHSSSPARIYMWSVNILDLLGNDVIIYCRSSGKPRPSIKWLLNDEDMIRSDDRHTILENGDLLIRNLQWEDMGEYSCTADNQYGRDSASTFLYPARRQ